MLGHLWDLMSPGNIQVTPSHAHFIDVTSMQTPSSVCTRAQVRLGPLTPHAVHTLRHLKDFLGVVFDMRTEQASRTIFMSCLGAGVRNLAKKVT